MFSFLGSVINFARDPLTVQHGLVEQPLGYFDVPNVWQSNVLEIRLNDDVGDPTNWRELIDACGQRFDRLMIPEEVLNRLATETFYPVVCKRILELCRILQSIMNGRAADGSLNEEALALWQTHGRGDNAWFTDESEGNKKAFRDDLTFPDPETPGRTVFCSWHGKIRSPQFRIHFEWPVPAQQTHLRILYIGPKITKA